MNARTSLAATVAFLAGCGVATELDDIRVQAESPAQHSITHDSAAVAPALPQDGDWPTPLDLAERAARGVEPFDLLHCAETTVIQSGRDDRKTGPIVALRLRGASTWRVVIERGDGYSWAEFTSDRPLPEVLVSDGFEVRCERPSLEVVEPDGGEHTSHFFYAAELVSPRDPIFVGHSDALDESGRGRLEQLLATDWTAATVADLIQLGPPSNSYVWGLALGWAMEQGELELAYEIHRRYRPVGRCSRDTAPQRVKQQFAELCASTGRDRCALAVTTQLLAYRHSRVSDMWIGGRPVSYTSELDQLPEEIDAPRFMLGLLLDYPGTPGADAASISPTFFALSVYGTEHGPPLLAKIERWLAAGDLDTFNAHRLTLAAWRIRLRLDPLKAPAAHAKEVAALAGVPFVTASILRTL